MSSQIGIVTFDSEEKADEVLKSLEKLEKEKMISLKDVAVVVKDSDGKVKVKETADFSKKRGTVTGGTIGFVIGLMVGGPIGGALLGTAAGYFTGKKIDLGVSKDKIQAVTEGMENSSSAIFVQVESVKDAGILPNLMREADGTLYEIDLTDEHEADIDDALSGMVARH
ncbi:MAG: DUF1269 domain-containing protein [Anaerolineales bacterium]|nr:DUF1269 domain-containing protein [Anaerolineales bacterium]